MSFVLQSTGHERIDSPASQTPFPQAKEATVTASLPTPAPPGPVHEIVKVRRPAARPLINSEPESAFAPDQSPEAVQLVAFEDDQVTVTELPRGSEGGE